LHRALREQQIHALVMEALIRPIDEIIANWERHLAGTALMRGFIAALLNFHSLGYDSKGKRGPGCPLGSAGRRG